MTCWTRRHKVGWQVTPSASRYPFWGRENPRVILIESTVSTYSHKGSKVTRFIASKSQKWGQGHNELGEGSLPLEPELEDRVASTCYLQTGCDGSNRLFSGSTLSGYLNNFPGRSKVGNWNITSYCKYKNNSNSKYWKGWGEIGIHCWWES